MNLNLKDKIDHTSIMEFLRQIEREISKLEKIKKIHGEIMLEYAYIDSLLSEADKRTVGEIREQDAKLTTELKRKCFEAYEQIITKRTDASSSRTLLDRWLERVENKQYCYQGGLGYQVDTSLKSLPHHWVVKEGYYDVIKPTVWEQIAFLIQGETYRLDSTLRYQSWGN